MNCTNKLRMYSLALALALALICCSPAAAVLAASETAESAPAETTAAAAEVPEPAPEAIPVFPDVFEDDWFYADVTRLASEKVLNGYPDGYFYPERDITNAEFIKILMISAGFDLGQVPDKLLFAEHWASLYISLAYEHGIISDAELESGFDPSAPITRSAMTKMMILALGIEPARIDDPFTDISDIYASTAYNEYLLRGYLLADDTRIYDGDSNASRSEAAAIAVRIIEYRADSYTYKKNAILENASQNQVNNEFELLDLFYILNREFMTEFTFETTVSGETLKEYYRHSNVIHLEYFYSSYIEYTYYTSTHKCTIKLAYDYDIEYLKQLHAASEEKADKIIASIITDDMSDTDKVKAIHDYVILNCAYDYNNYIADTIPDEARFAYGVLCNQSAICQGYSAAFNLLCNRVGIRTSVVTGKAPNNPDDHAWNMVFLDGQIYYIDITHDDPVPDQKGRISYKYYMLTEAEMTALGYVWDKNYSNLKYFY